MQLCLISTITVFVLGLIRNNSKYETIRTLDAFDIELKGELFVNYFSGTDNGNVTIILNEAPYSLQISGYKNGKNKFDITDEEKK